MWMYQDLYSICEIATHNVFCEKCMESEEDVSDDCVYLAYLVFQSFAFSVVAFHSRYSGMLKNDLEVCPFVTLTIGVTNSCKNPGTFNKDGQKL